MPTVKEQKAATEPRLLEHLGDTPTMQQRCDHRMCDAQAFVRVILPDGNDLVFCGHHFHDLENSLKKKEFLTEDYRDQIK